MLVSTNIAILDWGDQQSRQPWAETALSAHGSPKNQPSWAETALSAHGRQKGKVQGRGHEWGVERKGLIINKNNYGTPSILDRVPFIISLKIKHLHTTTPKRAVEKGKAMPRSRGGWSPACRAMAPSGAGRR